MTPAEDRRDRRIALALLGVLLLAFFAFAWSYVPRLNNNIMSDREFTGWTGPLATRLAMGERLYVDFVVPIPPGSFLVLAAVQQVSGARLLLQELWACTLAQVGLALIAYSIARRLASRRIGVLVAASSLVTMLALPKECFYDASAQLTAWASIALGVHALTADEPKRARDLGALAGFFATFTLGFKQSTGTGVVLGWAAAALYLALVKRSASSPSSVLGTAFGRTGRGVVAGAIAGLAGVAILVWSAGGTIHGFVRAVFLDSPELKGGRTALLATLGEHTFYRATFSGTLLITSLVILTCFALAKRHGALAFGLGQHPDTPNASAAVVTAATMVAAFGGAAILLGTSIRALPQWVLLSTHRLGELPGVGLVFATLWAVAHFSVPIAATAARTEPARRVQHTFTSFGIVAIITSLFHDASFDQFGTFYNNNPVIPLAFLGIFVAARQLGRAWALPLAFVIALAPIFALKLSRALSTDTRVAGGYWEGLTINFRGLQILKAARRIQELTATSDTVLTLPEDVQLAGLIDRPRPPLKGGIVFVDQYAKRLVREDLRILAAHPPKVIVIHPRKEADWRRLFATWNEHSGSADFMEHVIDELLPEYDLDSTYPTVHFWDQGALDVYVRRD